VTSVYSPEGSFVVGYYYDDFGQTEKRGDSNFYNEVCYTGGIYDESTSLYYLNARYYDPTEGRFISADIYRGDSNNPSSLHLYAYCANNPVNFTDPSGHLPRGVADFIIYQYKKYINSAAREFGVDAAILGGCIYAEQIMNVYPFEDTLDYGLFVLGMDVSVGVAQVRISTAIRVEDAGYMPKTNSKVTKVKIRGRKSINTVKLTVRREENIYKKLVNVKTNIRYAGAYLKKIQDFWINAYPTIASDSAVLGQLYNIGEGTPKQNPVPKEFGLTVEKYYTHIKKILGK
jgi:RHS repeat-associated protein